MTNVVIVGAGVAGVNAATKLVDNNFKGKITIIDMGLDPYRRPASDVMRGFLGAGGWSDGKLTYHTAIGGQLSKYTGEEKAMELFDQVINNFKRFILNLKKYNVQILKKNQILLNPILVYVYFQYGTLVLIIYTK